MLTRAHVGRAGDVGRAARRKVILWFSTRPDNTVGAGATVFLGPAGESAAESSVQAPVPFRGVARKLYVVSDSAAGASQTFTYTLMTTDGVAGTLTVQTGGANRTGNDLTHEDIIAAGSNLSVRLVTSGGAAATTHRAAIEYEELL